MHVSILAAKLKQRHKMWVVIALAVLVLGVASTYKLSEAPAIWLDEGFYTQLGVNVAQVGQQAFQVAPGEFVHSSYISVGYPLIYPLALSYKLFGAGVLQGRGVMVIFILLFALAAYWYVRLLFGPWQAAWSVLLLASFAELYGNGKSVLGEVPGLFFFTAALIGLFYLERSGYRSLRWYALVGVAAGLCASTKPIFILLLGALFFTYLLNFKNIKLTWKGFGLGLAALLTPLLLWIYTQFGSDVTLHSLLLDYVNPYSPQSAQSVTVQTVLQNSLRFFTESTPIYTALLMLIWAATLYVRRKAPRVSAAEISAFIFCVLIVLAYLRLPGWYRYLFPATTIALLFLAPSVFAVFEYLKKKWGFLEKHTWIPYAALALLFCAQLYQVAFSSYVAGYYGSTRTRDVTSAFDALPQGSSVFLYDVPELAILLPTRNYYQYLQPSINVSIGEGELAALQKGTPDYVVLSAGATTVQQVVFAKYQFFETLDRYEILKKVVLKST